MNNLLPFQFNCWDQPDWMTENFPVIEEHAEEIKLKDFIKEVDETNSKLLRDMIIFEYSFRYYKSNYNWLDIYYYVWSAIEYYYFNDELENF